MLERSNPPNTSFNKSYKAKWSKIGEGGIIAEKKICLDLVYRESEISQNGLWVRSRLKTSRVTLNGTVG